MIKKAFTLAEVLLVLAIIGVVSTLTIPNLADSYKEEHTSAQLKKLNKEFDDAIAKTIQKYGANWTTWAPAGEDIDGDEAIDRFVEFLDTKSNSTPFPYNEINSNDTFKKFELKDGTLLAILSPSETTSTSANCYEVYVGLDHIGNTIGKYVFGFTVNTDTGITSPLGAGKDTDDDGNLKLPSISINSVPANVYGTNWMMNKGNWEYLKLSGQKCSDGNYLNFYGKDICD